MTRRRKAFATVWILGLSLPLIAEPALARGRGGGGGGGFGGSGGFSSRSQAAGGSFGSRRSGGFGQAGGGSFGSRQGQASSRQGQRGQNQQTRTDQRGQNQQTRTDQRSQNQQTRTDQRDQNRQDRNDQRVDNREDWQDHAADMQDDRQQAARNRQEDRQDFYEDEVDHWHGHRYYHDDWDDDDFAAGVVTGFVIGTTLSMAAVQSMGSGSSPSCTMTTVPVAGVSYYRCGPNWYQKSYTNGEVAFVVVAPPPGY